MPLPREIVDFLIHGEDVPLKKRAEDYYDKVPTIGDELISDDLTISALSASGREHGKILKQLLIESGLSKGQRGGVTHILDSLSYLGDHEVTVGEVRALNEEELLKLRSHFTFATPDAHSILIIKKLFG